MMSDPVEQSAVPDVSPSEAETAPEVAEAVVSETPPPSEASSESPEPPVNSDRHLQVHLKSAGEHLVLSLPPETEFGGSWVELLQQLQLRLTGGDRFWQVNTPVHLMTPDRLIDARQLQAIADALNTVQLKLTHVYTRRRQTAVAAATAGYSVEQSAGVTPFNLDKPETPTPLAEPLYLQTTLRSGVEIRHPGTVIILGDLNPGSSVIADGDILVWGRLRGIAHAGAKGNSKCSIMALQMEATQLRIADQVARSPQTPPSQYYPEVAYASPEGIRISKATDFAKTQFVNN